MQGKKKSNKGWTPNLKVARSETQSRKTWILQPLSPLNTCKTGRVPPWEGQSYLFTRLFRGHTQGDGRNEGAETQGRMPGQREMAHTD